ncbi:TraM recognition domain-containing protein [Rubripirellula reticaptiva]|uniref:TraM recognition domain-containing protein n=1 Tax=Rubripirellula reticaptiva TaxID=2528013 RepID=UPI0016464831|nr:TraM recognition domain-containing protein [Rubripirellula reticaptiva]
MDADGNDIAYPVSDLEETNWLITGAPGSMKSVLAVSWMAQYIKHPDHAVVMVDLGGDLAGYHALKSKADAAGKPSYLICLDETVDCDGWDMLKNTPVFKLDPKRAVPGLMGALRLQSGEGYPNTFWSRHSAADVNKAVDGLKAIDKWSFEDLAEQLRQNDAESKNKGQVSEAFLAAEELCRYTRAMSSRERQLLIGQAIEEAALIYFFVPSGIEGGAARSIAAAANWCVMIEAALRFDSEAASKRTIHLVVDEFAQIASSGSTTESILNLARKWNVQLTLILQSIAQVPDDLQSVLRTNCQQAIFDAFTRDEQEHLRSLSLDVYQQGQRSMSVSGIDMPTQTQNEQVEPSLTRNEILEVSGIKSQFFLALKLGNGYQQPVVAKVKPAISLEEHNIYKQMPLPRLGTPLSVPSRTDAKQFESVPDPALLELMNRIKSEQTWWR